MAAESLLNGSIIQCWHCANAVAKLTNHAFKLLPVVSKATTAAEVSDTVAQGTSSDVNMLLLSSGFTLLHTLCALRSAYSQQHTVVHCMPRV